MKQSKSSLWFIHSSFSPTLLLHRLNAAVSSVASWQVLELGEPYILLLSQNSAAPSRAAFFLTRFDILSDFTQSSFNRNESVIYRGAHVFPCREENSAVMALTWSDTLNLCKWGQREAESLCVHVSTYVHVGNLKRRVRQQCCTVRFWQSVS